VRYKISFQALHHSHMAGAKKTPVANPEPRVRKVLMGKMSGLSFSDNNLRLVTGSNQPSKDEHNRPCKPGNKENR
jgi:hypothetical protein